MANPADQVSRRQRRANWVGLKTLRQRPKPVGVLPGGEPVYEVRGVRLVLRGQASHFSRVVACQRCGKDQTGVPVLSAADLDAPLRPMICGDCVRKAGVSSVWQPEAARAPEPRVAPRAPEAQDTAARLSPVAAAPGAAPPVEAAGSAGDRLEAMERRLEAMTARVEQLSRLAVAQETAIDEGRKAGEAARTALQAAMADVRAELATAAEASAKSAAELAQLVESQRADISAIVEAVGQVRADVARVAEANQGLAQAHAEVQQRASSSAEQEAGVRAAVDERLDQLGDELARATARIEALVSLSVEPAGEVHTREQGAEGARLLEALEQQLQAANNRLEALSGTVLRDAKRGEPGAVGPAR